MNIRNKFLAMAKSSEWLLGKFLRNLSFPLSRLLTDNPRKAGFLFLPNTSLSTGLLSASVFVLVMMTSCKKLVETPVPTNLVAENAVYTNDATAISVLNAVYTAMNTGPFQGSLSSNGSISLFAGLA